jgi:hypothetical protein
LDAHKFNIALVYLLLPKAIMLLPLTKLNIQLFVDVGLAELVLQLS